MLLLFLKFEEESQTFGPFRAWKFEKFGTQAEVLLSDRARSGIGIGFFSWGGVRAEIWARLRPLLSTQMMHPNSMLQRKDIEQKSH